MAVNDQELTDKYAIYNGDCIEVMRTMPDASVHMSIYSPPFAGLYNYSSSDRDLSNARSYEEFFEHYKFKVPDHVISVEGLITAADIHFPVLHHVFNYFPEH